MNNKTPKNSAKKIVQNVTKPVAKNQPTKKKPNHKKKPQVKLTEVDHSSVKIIEESKQSEIKTVIAESPKINVILDTHIQEVIEPMEPITVTETIMSVQEEPKSYECENVEVNCNGNCSCNDSVGYDINITEAKKEGLLKRVWTKIKNIFK